MAAQLMDEVALLALAGDGCGESGIDPAITEDEKRRAIAGLAELDPVSYELRKPAVARSLNLHPRAVDRIAAALRREFGHAGAAVRAIGLTELLRHEFPVREFVLEPVFQLHSLNMLFAWRGCGKTHAALGIAYAAASGGEFFGWRASRPFRVLYLDGEMPGEAMQARLASILAGSSREPPPDFFRILSIDVVGGIMPDLATAKGQAAIAEECDRAELIVVDNLSCLVRGQGKENDAESWLAVAEWALPLRSAGKCVLFIHHTGKNGEQRGTSKKEDLLDVSIALKRPADYTADQGARFVVEFSKARHLVGEESAPFEAWLKRDEQGRQVWTTQNTHETTYDQVIDLANLGLSQTDIAKELGVNKSTVCRHWHQAIQEGRIKSKAKLASSADAKGRKRRADTHD